MHKYNEGCPSKITKREAEDIKTTIEQNRMITIPQMSQTFKLSERSMSSKLQELDYKKVKSLNRTGLTGEAIIKRMQYCIIHKYDKFSNVIFADEAVLQLQENRYLIWCSSSEPKSALEPVLCNFG